MEYYILYLFSESTLLVSSRRFILKTCGNTTLLSAIPPLILLVNKYYPGAGVMVTIAVFHIIVECSVWPAITNLIFK